MISSNLTPGSKPLNQLDGILDLVKNADLYTSRLNELKEAEQSAIAATKNLTKAKNIDELLAKAKKNEEDTAKVLAEAKTKAQQVISDAEERAANAIAKAMDSVREMEAKSDKLKADIAELEVVRQSHINFVKSEEIRIDDMRWDAKQQMEKAEAMKDEYQSLLLNVRTFLKGL